MVTDLKFLLSYLSSGAQTKEIRLNLVLQRDEFLETYKVQKVILNRVLISIVL